jgi:hypothetical protein
MRVLFRRAPPPEALALRVNHYVLTIIARRSDSLAIAAIRPAVSNGRVFYCAFGFSRSDVGRAICNFVPALS